MTRNLELICRELGLTQYLDAFVDQGFDTWDTVLDIQESDLSETPRDTLKKFSHINNLFSDALGVKLGHRRVCQVYPVNKWEA